jgi:N-acetylglucosaminyldiphosphoundecaprenol N-acetyl-beta-D-mannosaminyltransferase
MPTFDMQFNYGSMKTFHIKGIPISIDSKINIQKWALNAITRSPFTPVVTFNTTMIGAHSQPLRNWLIEHAIFFSDGIGINTLIFMAYGQVTTRYPGIQLVQDILNMHPGLRIALIGSKPIVLDHTIKWIKQTYPHHSICFSKHGYTPLNSTDYEWLAKANPSLTLVAMGCPKQEALMQKLSEILDSGIAIGVGGAFDIWSGLKKRAPTCIQVIGLEWLYRIILEPWRIKRLLRSLLAITYPISTK